MRFSPTKLLHGLLYTAPVLLLTLAACGGGGGSSTPTTPVVSAYTLSVTVTGVSGSGLVLRNNGGDDLPVTAAGTYSFGTQVTAGAGYNVTVLTHPSLPQLCTVTSPSGTMPASTKTVTVDCVNAYKISANITGTLTSTGLVLQNKGGDNRLIPAATGPYDFNTPLIGTDTYNVTVLTQPLNQNCTPPSTNGPVSGAPVTVTISCGAYVAPAADRYVYAANSVTNNVSTYTQTGGALPPAINVLAGSGPAAIAVDRAGQFAYVVNTGTTTGSISGYKITTGALVPMVDVDAGLTGDQASITTENTPVAITIHPSGKFVYVVNKISNSISAYSIDAVTGKLSQMDANGALSGTSIATGKTPVAIAIDPAGTYAYVVNVGAFVNYICGHGTSPSTNGCISAYSIDNYGVLTAINVSGNSLNIDTGVTPSSITIDSNGQNVYVTNFTDNNVLNYPIGATGTLNPSASVATGTGPSSMAIHPGSLFAYVVSSGGNVYIYDRNPIGGALAPDPTPTVVAGTLPISISIDRLGNYAYVANYGTDNSISTYSIIAGVLNVVGSYPAGTSPISVTTAP